MKKNKKNTKKTMIVVGIVCLLIIVLVAKVISNIPNGNSNYDSDISRSTEETYVDYPDVYKYFEDKASIQSIVSVKDSQDILSEKEVVKEFEKRGFSDVTITTSYAMNGEYIEEKEITNPSEDKHPMYEAKYVNSNGELWLISYINNQFLATPITYRITSDCIQSIVFSEQDTITSYDSLGNRYFITIPNDDSLTVKVVSNIDSRTLDGLTTEEIEK